MRRFAPITEGRPFSSTRKRDSRIEAIITTATNNSAVSPKIYSWGFFSPAIHRAGRCLRLKSSQTAHAAQFPCELQPFYAKQTQLPKSKNEPNCLLKQDLWKYSSSRTAKKQTQFQSPHRRSEFIPTRRGSPLVSSLLIFMLRIYFGFRYSDFVLQPNNYAKQTQFPKTRNEPNPLLQKGLWRLSCLQPPKKQTQTTPISNPLLFTDNSSSFLAWHQLRTPFSNRCAQSRTYFFETPQKLQKIASLSHIFSFFLTFSQVFARFQHFSPPIGAFVRAILPQNPHSRPKKTTQMRISHPPFSYLLKPCRHRRWKSSNVVKFYNKRGTKILKSNRILCYY